MQTEGFTVWFTGLSGSGKSTLAGMLRDELVARGLHGEVLDSGRIRQALNRSLGFSREEIDQAMMRIAYECKMLNRNGIAALVAAVSPYRDVRDRIREDVGRFVEVHCRCPMSILMQRDDKTLFERAERGELSHVAGINAPYEEPFQPEVLCNTDVESAETGVAKIVAALKAKGYIPDEQAAEYTNAEDELIKQRMRDLGYI